MKRPYPPERHLVLSPLAFLRRLAALVPLPSILEERTVGPVDRSGLVGMTQLAIAPDGRDVAFMFCRTLGHLYILRGLPSCPR